MTESFASTSSSRQIELIIRRLNSLSTLPEVMAGFLSHISGDKFDAAGASEIIESDPSLTAKIYSMAYKEGVLSPDEKELGVAVVDIGGGTTDMAVFIDGAVQHTAIMVVGGDQLTNDIAVGLKTPMAEAEKIKKRYGCALGAMVDKDETMSVPGVGGRGPRLISRSVLADIAEPRLEEIFGIVRRELEKFNMLDQVHSGIVLTGGTVAIEGVCELAEQIFDMPVRIGYPTTISGLVDVVNSPVFATGVGLVKWGALNRGMEMAASSRNSSMLDEVVGKVRRWFSEAF